MAPIANQRLNKRVGDNVLEAGELVQLIASQRSPGVPIGKKLMKVGEEVEEALRIRVSGVPHLQRLRIHAPFSGGDEVEAPHEDGDDIREGAKRMTKEAQSILRRPGCVGDEVDFGEIQWLPP